MRDIAAKLGLSAMTVSCALNGRGRVAEETSKRVWAAAKEMGFRKDLVASSNANRRAKSPEHLTIAFNARGRIEDATDAIHLYRDIYFALLDRLGRAGHELVLTDDREPRFASVLAMADAIVELDRVPASSLAVSAAPRICAFFEEPGRVSVMPDNEAAGRLAAELLVRDLGCRRLAVNWDGDTADQRARLDAFIRHCRALAPDAAVETLISSPEALAAALGRPADSRPEALFVLFGCGMLAAHKAATKLGLAVPDDISILGFDDFPVYDWLPYKASRLYYKPEEIADAIADAARGIGEGKSPIKLITPTYYKAGDSLAPAHAG